LLQGAKGKTTDGKTVLVVDQGEINSAGYDGYVSGLGWHQKFGAAVVSCVWLYLIFLLVIGFGYSYFWTASTIIYLLMRRKVDDAEMDEIYLEEDDQDLTYSPPPAPSGTPAPTPGPSLTMVEPPSLRPPAPVPEPHAPADATPPPVSPGPSTDGGAAPGGAS
jgi:hypothetical protein